MRSNQLGLVFALLGVAAGCERSAHQDSADTDAAAAEAAGAAAEPTEQDQLTYWQDMVPLFEQHCMQCHRDGGIAPFRLDDYASVAPLADLIAHVTRERTMPPWLVTSDGSCGEFANSAALSDDEIERIASWAQAGAAEGEPRAIHIPELPTLAEATELVTPEFTPEAQGGELAKYDEYRCFKLSLPEDAAGYITGYEVLPGRPEIVHHAVAFMIDPDAPADSEDAEALQLTNRERMQALDDESPDRDGWPCFGAAGDGVSTEGSPVVWAPGQGVVRFPEGTGVALRPEQQLVVQIHYNLSDPNQHGKSDQTRVRLQIEPEVEEEAVFVMADLLLDTLFRGEPASLPPHESSTLYSWTSSARELGMEGEHAKLYGIMPHMHELGRKYEFSLAAPEAEPQCTAQVKHWDFHWQRMYFYDEPLDITPDTQLSTTCEYDTTSVSQPVRAGWGTRNEMCLATLYLTFPGSKR